MPSSRCDASRPTATPVRLGRPACDRDPRARARPTRHPARRRGASAAVQATRSRRATRPPARAQWRSSAIRGSSTHTASGAISGPRPRRRARAPRGRARSRPRRSRSSPSIRRRGAHTPEGRRGARSSRRRARRRHIAGGTQPGTTPRRRTARRRHRVRRHGMRRDSDHVAPGAAKLAAVARYQTSCSSMASGSRGCTPTPRGRSVIKGSASPSTVCCERESRIPRSPCSREAHASAITLRSRVPRTGRPR